MPAINYQRRARNLLYGLTLICIFIAGILLWLNTLMNWQSDWTYNNRNTLTPASQALLAQMQGPLHIEAYYDSNAQIRGQVRRFIGRYQRFKADTFLTFIDTQLGSEELAQKGYAHLGQIKISYADRQQIITRLNEQKFTSTLFALTRKHQPWIAVLQGHGERDPLDTGTHGLSKFTQQLKKIGVNVQPINLLNNAVIPDNTQVLMLAGSRQAYLGGELRLIEEYLRQGGNLLWLREPAQQNYFASLDSALDIAVVPGVVIDANAKLRVVLGIKHPAVVPVVNYQPHTITKSLQTHSLFPFSAAFKVLDNSAWQANPLLSSLERTWSEVGQLNTEELTFEEDRGDTRGPLTMGMALSRNIDTIEQRAVVVGDSDFLANGYIGNGANLELGLNIMNWLTEDESLMAITPRAAPDQTIELNDNNIIFIATLLLLIVPTLLIATGFIIRWRRNRH